LFSLKRVANRACCPIIDEAELLTAIDPAQHSPKDETDVTILKASHDHTGICSLRKFAQHPAVEIGDPGLLHAPSRDAFPAL